MSRTPFVALATLLLVAGCSAPGPAPTSSPRASLSATVGMSTAPSTAPTASAMPSPTGTASEEPRSPVGEVTLVTHDSFAASDSVIADFESQTGATLHVLKGGDAGAMVNQAILTKNAPLGDVLYGVDNTFLSRALDAGIFQSFTSSALSSIPDEFKTGGDFRVTPIDYGDVCINADLDYGHGNAALVWPPVSINDLTKPIYKGTLVAENPATSSPGLAFVLATIVRFGESGDYTWLDYWRDLRANDILVVPDWNSAYYNEFSGGAGAGDRPLVVSYATSPAAEVLFADPPTDVAPTQNLDDGCFRQIEYAAVLTGAKNSAGAQAWINYMAAPQFQSDMPLNMFVFPVNPQAQIPDLFTKYPSKATEPLTMDPASIAANRDKWIQEWTDAVIH